MTYPLPRKEAARKALASPPGLQRQVALEDYLLDHSYSIPAVRTLVFQAIVCSESHHIPPLARDLFKTVSPSNVAAMCDESLRGPGGNEEAQLGDPERRRIAHQLHEAALEAQLIDDWEHAIESGDPIEQARFMYKYGQYDRDCHMNAEKLQEQLHMMGQHLPIGRVVHCIRDYFSGNVTSVTERCVLAFASTVRLPETEAELRSHLMYRRTSSEQHRGRPYVTPLSQPQSTNFISTP